ncbi:ssDNA-binding domain-containing protein [Antribacter sp. KLBMP9083]|uniref:SsDNA-binding domain-containing protein n=1 Tax=Antribacter soli TaxID=2910976 RepID=A0AA41QHU5_9MICO|nr:ArdC-like ssDNA-binding domain-containing protein [Antribacter soli]MCF4123694.1 ssDNA-binding domain-containing protein [Antribacter soli]
MRTEDRSPETQAAERQAKLDALHEQLTGAVEQLVTGEDWQRALRFTAKFRRYSFGNCLLLYQQSLAAYEAGLLPEPYPQFVAGYRQWQSLGRFVLKGAKSFQILAPTTARVALADDGTVRRLAKGEKPGPGETVTTRMVGTKVAHVFPAEFTDGEPLPETPVPQLLQGQAPPGLWDGLAAQIQAKGFTLGDAPNAAAIGGANGVTKFGTKEILVRDDMDPLQRTKTLAHEVGHLDAHSPEDPDVPSHRGLAEVEAESIALVILSAHNADSSQYTVPYVSTWASRVEGVDPVTAVQQTAARVRSVALQILDRLDTQLVPDGDPPGLARTGPEPTQPAKPATVPDDGLDQLDLRGQHHARPGSAVMTEGVGR